MKRPSFLLLKNQICIVVFNRIEIIEIKKMEQVKK